MLQLPCMLVCNFVMRKSHASPPVAAESAPVFPCALFFLRANQVVCKPRARCPPRECDLIIIRRHPSHFFGG